MINTSIRLLIYFFFAVAAEYFSSAMLNIKPTIGGLLLIFGGALLAEAIEGIYKFFIKKKK